MAGAERTVVGKQGLGGFMQRSGKSIEGEEAPGPGVNEPSVFSGGDGLILYEGRALARRVESSVELALDWDEVYFQGQFTVGALVLKSIKITGGIKQATADLSMVRRWCGLNDQQGSSIEGATIRDVRYIPPVDVVLVLDRSMIPATVASYEAVLIYNAQMNSFSLPISAASTVFNDQKWTAMNMAFRGFDNKQQSNLRLSGRWVDAATYDNKAIGGVPEGSHDTSGARDTMW
jgi:hypothetical protein